MAQTVGSTTKRYVYDPGNLRVWKEGHVYFYGIDGNLLATYGDGAITDYNVYFGSKQIWQEAAEGLAAHPVNSDRLDSNVKHFPYGEESTTTTQNRTKFATYYRDSSTALDYARNRYYARTIGRFTSVDPSWPGSLANPQSLNRYSYSGNDPVNFNDPSGLMISTAASVFPLESSIHGDHPAGHSGLRFMVLGERQLAHIVSSVHVWVRRGTSQATGATGFMTGMPTHPAGAVAVGAGSASNDSAEANPREVFPVSFPNG